METTQMFLLISVSICVCHTARQFVPLDPAHFGVCILFGGGGEIEKRFVLLHCYCIRLTYIVVQIEAT